MSPKLVSCHLMLRSPAGLVERILEELLICLRAGGEWALELLVQLQISETKSVLLTAMDHKREAFLRI